ncbi:hypothetical protein ACH0B6_16985 [Solibacillus silvestris]
MKKSFSKLNLLSQDYISPFKSGLSKLFQLDLAKLTIILPYYDYLRGLVFIDDVKQVFEDEAPEELDLAALLSLLHDDFLYHTQKGVRSHQETVNFLLNAKKTYLKKPKQNQKGNFKQVQLNTFIFVHEEDEDNMEEEIEQPEEDNMVIEMVIRKAKIQRTEILLYDLSSYMDQDRITVEELITILFLDFIDRIKKGGNNEKIMRSIIKGVEFYK